MRHLTLPFSEGNIVTRVPEKYATDYRTQGQLSPQSGGLLALAVIAAAPRERAIVRRIMSLRIVFVFPYVCNFLNC
jgi:hypothetical protein